MHPDDEFILQQVDSCIFSGGTAGHPVQKNESSSVVFWLYKKFGMRKSWLYWTVSKHCARNHPSDASIVDVWLLHEMKLHGMIPFSPKKNCQQRYRKITKKIARTPRNTKCLAAVLFAHYDTGRVLSPYRPANPITYLKNHTTTDMWPSKGGKNA